MNWPITIFVLLLAARAVFAATPVKPDFNRDVRPILSENCFYCHGQDPYHRKADLRLDDRETALKLKAIVPGKPGESELVRRIFATDDDLMPPEKSHRTLTSAQKETLKRWVASGAEYQPHWAYQTPVRPAVPAVKNKKWARNDLDRFVLAKLGQEKFNPSPEADRATLIRRLSIDLVGLPPTPEEVDAFLADQRPDAYEQLVERLLASPHYGERLALPWLNAARYADSNGFQQDGDSFQWLWRDWLVHALNADVPFDQFSIEQLAGDLLPKATPEQKLATAFNRNHLLNGEGGAIAEEQRFVALFDRVDTTATTWLGLTMACAQCHDHKYDPMTQRDYYGMMALFNQLPENGLAGGGKRIRAAGPTLDLSSPEQKKQLAGWEAELKNLEAEANLAGKREVAWTNWSATVETNRANLPHNITPILAQPAAERSEADKKAVRRHFEEKVWPDLAKKDPLGKKVDVLKGRITNLKNEEMPRVMVMEDTKPRDTFILDRGEYLKPKAKVTFAPPSFLPPQPAGAASNRLGFAHWLFQPEHPLTARVQVNRMWQYFFGNGLVKTVEDLGVQSEVPVHRDLLDWLAVEFRERAWSQKHIHRLIVTSATYRQSSRATPELIQRDPENRLMARASRFRMPSLILRDVALSASGLLDARIGGAPVYPYQPDAVWETLAITKERDFTYPASKGADLYRRSLYTFWRRTVGPVNMFDASARQTCRVGAGTTSTPLHALTTLNDVTWMEAARVLAEKTLHSERSRDAQLTFAFRRVLGRVPTKNDLKLLARAYDRQHAIYAADAEAATKLVSSGAAARDKELNPADHAAMSTVCLALFNLDEALTRE